MNRSTSGNGPLPLKRYGIAQHPVCIDPVPSWQQASSIWCARHESLHHTGGRVDENRLHLPINVPVCSAVATSAAAGGRGRSIGIYGGWESAGSAIGLPLLTWEMAKSLYFCLCFAYFLLFSTMALFAVFWHE